MIGSNFLQQNVKLEIYDFKMHLQNYAAIRQNLYFIMRFN